MGRLRDHRVRFTNLCPDPDGCARLFHGSIVSGMAPGDICECCGAEYDPRYVSKQTAQGCWAVYDTRTQSWPALIGGRSVPSSFDSDDQAQRWADKHLNV